MRIALDLEGVLISNAISRFARPGAWKLVEAASNLGEVVLYTSVRKEVAGDIIAALEAEKHIPIGIIKEIHNPTGSAKPLRPLRIDWLLDDQPDHVAVLNERNMVKFVPGWEFPYSPDDRTLYDLAARLPDLLVRASS